jgi:hypothetical protein
MQKMGWDHLKIFSKTRGPGKLRLELKFPDVV